MVGTLLRFLIPLLAGVLILLFLIPIQNDGAKRQNQYVLILAVVIIVLTAIAMWYITT